LAGNGETTFITGDVMATSDRLADPDLDSECDSARACGSPFQVVDERCGADRVNAVIARVTELHNLETI
jgi:hypothetical protein